MATADNVVKDAARGPDVDRASLTWRIGHGAGAFLRPTALLLMLVTLLLAMTIWPLAILTGALAIATTVAALLAHEVESHAVDPTGATHDGPEPLGEAADRSLAESHADDPAEGRADEPDETFGRLGGWVIPEMLIVVGKRIAVFVAGLAVLASLAALALLDITMFLIGGATILVYMVILTFPLWAGLLFGDTVRGSTPERMARQHDRL